jgi:excisionase family DNA binding protein
MTTEVKATISVKELSVILGCSLRHTYKMCYEHKIPSAQQLGHKWIATRVTVMRWLENDNHSSDSEYQLLIHGGKSR